MPVRDHFVNPQRRTWDRVHGGWPMVIAQHLVRTLPEHYNVAPLVTIGHLRNEIDVVTLEIESSYSRVNAADNDECGVATALWAPPEPTLTLETDPRDPDEYEVRIYDAEGGERLVAAIELVSPSNKDRPSAGLDFVMKCIDLLQHDVCVSIVDLVTPHHFNLYAELLERLGHTTPDLPSSCYLYAATIHRRNGAKRWRLDNWAYELHVGQPLPSLPIWLNEQDGTMLDLEATYEETCKTLKVR